MQRLAILAPGFSSPPPSTWNILASRLEREGYNTLRVSYPNFGSGSIEASSMGIGTLIEAVSKSFDHITFIGHSMGSLVGRYLIQEVKLPIDSYISIAGPHQGTWIAKFGTWMCTAVNQMAQNSRFLTRLNSNKWDSSIPALGLQAQHEACIWPRSSAEISFGQNVSIPHTTHANIIFSGRTSAEIIGWMKDNG